MVTVPVITAAGQLTQATLPEFERIVAPYLENNGPGLVLDLGRVGFVSSAGLGCFVRIGKTLEEQGRVLVLARVVRPVERVLRAIGLDEVFPIFRAVVEAQAWVAQRAVREL
jgi:anti-sigma B factor antagonist